jgi:pyruvate/2-oxoglutarate/acetoin dehydrogenase E1 component
LHSVLGHFPGLHVCMPATPEAAMQLTYTALKSDTPTVILEHRALFEIEGNVPASPSQTSIGKAKIVREGSDITIVATSFMVQECLQAADSLMQHGISAEIIDLQWIRPLDKQTILKSVKKTGRLVATDVTWELFGVSSEVCALVAEQAFEYLKSPVRRVCVADVPAPVSKPLEAAFYPSANTIASVVSALFGKQNEDNIESAIPGDEFKGPY